MATYQQPSSYSFKSPVNYLMASADGSVKDNFWGMVPRKLEDPQYSPNISLIKPYGGVINGYQNSIIRPLDNVSLKNDIKRGTFCNEPCFAGSHSQSYCEPDVGKNFYGMRSVIQNSEYNKMLKELFRYIVPKSSGICRPDSLKNNCQISLNDKKLMTWSAVQSSDTTEQLMSFVMKKIAIAVKNLPIMHDNGSYGNEQFHYTDADVFQFTQTLAKPDGLLSTSLNGSSMNYYNIIFNLYNALRNVSTLVELTILNIPQGFQIVYFDLLDNTEWTATQESAVNGLVGYNLGNAAGDSQINLTDGPKPVDVQWNYGNTLLKQEFNQYGFFDANNNVKVEASVPESLVSSIRNFEQNSPSYLISCNVPKYTGQILQNNIKDRKFTVNDGYARNVLNNPQIIYNQVPQTNGQIRAKPIENIVGGIRT